MMKGEKGVVGQTIAFMMLCSVLVIAFAAVWPEKMAKPEKQIPDVILHDGRECVTLDPQGKYLYCEAQYGDEVVGDYLCFKSNSQTTKGTTGRSSGLTPR